MLPRPCALCGKTISNLDKKVKYCKPCAVIAHKQTTGRWHVAHKKPRKHACCEQCGTAFDETVKTNQRYCDECSVKRKIEQDKKKRTWQREDLKIYKESKFKSRLVKMKNNRLKQDFNYKVKDADAGGISYNYPSDNEYDGKWCYPTVASLKRADAICRELEKELAV